MRMPPLPADFIHARACKLKCEKILTRPKTLVRRKSAAGQKAASAKCCIFFVCICQVKSYILALHYRAEM